MLPTSFLRQLIGLYGDSMQFLVPGYLEQAMIAFARNQEQMRKSLQATFGNLPVRTVRGDGQAEHRAVRARAEMLAPYGRDEKPAAVAPEAKPKEGEDPRLKRLERKSTR